MYNFEMLQTENSYDKSQCIPGQTATWTTLNTQLYDDSKDLSEQDAPAVTPPEWSNLDMCYLQRLLMVAESELRNSKEEKEKLDQDFKTTKAELEETKSKLLDIESSLDISKAHANEIACQLHKCVGDRDTYQLMHATAQAEAVILREKHFQEIQTHLQRIASLQQTTINLQGKLHCVELVPVKAECAEKATKGERIILIDSEDDRAKQKGDVIMKGLDKRRRRVNRCSSPLYNTSCHPQDNILKDLLPKEMGSERRTKRRRCLSRVALKGQ
jgi:hypothetical protein